ncbi:MAG: thiol peroxidase [Chlamydiales bacterium]|nr:thiol peroxidase [Chlamydiales bacterium]
MSEVKFKGKPTRIVEGFPNIGDQAKDFELLRPDLSTAGLKDFDGKIKLLNIFVSLDTPVCAKSITAFDTASKAFMDLIVLNISMDLPFAASRFCISSQMEQAVTLSTFRSAFPDDYGVRIADGPLKGLCARAIILLGKDNRVIYTELVEEITQEPNYGAVLDAIKQVV